MKKETYHLEFITPCFCGGAEQTVAELRATAIRGELRWWFRALGGSAREEDEVFGGVRGNSQMASSLWIRAKALAGTGKKDWWQKLPKQGLDSKTYLLGFFCGRTGRLQSDGALAPQSRGELQLIFRKSPTEKLRQAIHVFLSVGALGLRSTRAAGAFSTNEHPLTERSWNSLRGELSDAGFQVGLLKHVFRDWVDVCERSGHLLKNELRGRTGLRISAGRNSTSPNALGSAAPRQASVLRFRPVVIDEKIRLALLEAPHARILGQKALRAHNSRGSILKSAGLAG
jgi:hypothetical protein